MQKYIVDNNITYRFTQMASATGNIKTTRKKLAPHIHVLHIIYIKKSWKTLLLN